MLFYIGIVGDEYALRWLFFPFWHDNLGILAFES